MEVMVRDISRLQIIFMNANSINNYNNMIQKLLTSKAWTTGCMVWATFQLIQRMNFWIFNKTVQDEAMAVRLLVSFGKFWVKLLNYLYWLDRLSLAAFLTICICVAYLYGFFWLGQNMKEDEHEMEEIILKKTERQIVEKIYHAHFTDEK